MDTKQVAEKLGTTPRVFRVFLRSPISTFVAVGSGSRYEFSDDEFPMLAKRFNEWKAMSKTGTPASSRKSVRPTVPTSPRTKPKGPSKLDLETWQEEGPVVMEDIRNPAVRARILADARAAEDRLAQLLIAKGMHITQSGNLRKVS